MRELLRPEGMGFVGIVVVMWPCCAADQQTDQRCGAGDLSDARVCEGLFARANILRFHGFHKG
jgi:hypothetical protein